LEQVPRAQLACHGWELILKEHVKKMSGRIVFVKGMLASSLGQGWKGRHVSMALDLPAHVQEDEILEHALVW
jgi:hypothetical protein